MEVYDAKHVILFAAAIEMYDCMPARNCYSNLKM